MGTYTPNLNLYKPAIGEIGWGALVNGSFDTLDGVLPPLRQGPESFTLYTGQSSPWPRAVSTGVDEQPDMRPAADGVLTDPLGMMQTTTYVSDTFGETWGPGSWVRLPLGTWMVQLVTKWDSNTTGQREHSMGTFDDRQNIADVDGFWWTPGYVQNMSAGPTRIHASSLVNGLQVSLSFVAVTPEMLASSDAQSTAGQGVATGVTVFQNSGANRNVEYQFLSMVKIAGYPVST